MTASTRSRPKWKSPLFQPGELIGREGDPVVYMTVLLEGEIRRTLLHLARRPGHRHAALLAPHQLPRYDARRHRGPRPANVIAGPPLAGAVARNFGNNRITVPASNVNAAPPGITPVARHRLRRACHTRVPVVTFNPGSHKSGVTVHVPTADSDTSTSGAAVIDSVAVLVFVPLFAVTVMVAARDEAVVFAATE